MRKARFKSGRHAVEALPRALKVGPFDFAIEKLTAQRAIGKDCFGEFSPSEGQIALQLDMPSPVKAADTLLHEAGHAIYATYGLDDEDKEERIVAVFATAWAQVFRDNAWLLGWLGGALSGKVVAGFPSESATTQKALSGKVAAGFPSESATVPKDRAALRFNRIAKRTGALP